MPRGLSALAWQIVEDENIPEDQKDLELAIIAARKGAELTNYEDPIALDALARVHFARGELDEAVEYQSRVIALEVPNQFRDRAEVRLEEYRTALAERDGESEQD